MIARHTTRQILLPATCLLYLVFLLLPLVVRGLHSNSRIWKGHYTLLLREAAGPSAAGPSAADHLVMLDVLHRVAGDDNVVCRETATAAFSGLVWAESSRLERISVKSLESRLDPLDPRYDPYLKEIPRFFRATRGDENWEVFYVRSGQHPLLFFMRLSWNLRKIDLIWRLPDFDPAGKLWSLAHLGVCVLILLVCRRPVDRTAAVCAVFAVAPWCFFAMGGGLRELTLAFLNYLGWYLLFLELYPLMRSLQRYGWFDPDCKHLLSQLTFYGLVRTVTGVSVALTGAHVQLLTLFLLTLAEVALCGCAFVFHARGFQSLRRSFEPVAIVFGFQNVTRSLRDNAFLVGIAFVIASSSIAFYVNRPVREFSLPLPVPTAKGFSWESLRMLWSSRLPESLPTLADFLAHVSFQEDFIVGRAYMMPTPQEEIQITRYSYDTVRQEVVRSFQTVRVYDNAWLSGRLADQPTPSLERMLIDQGGPVVVSLNGADEPNELALLLRESAATYVLLVVLVLWNFRLTPLVLYGMRKRIYERV